MENRDDSIRHNISSKGPVSYEFYKNISDLVSMFVTQKKTKLTERELLNFNKERENNLNMNCPKKLNK
jgi:hypothetical protein